MRGIKLGADDEVNSLCVLRHVDATVEERTAFLRVTAARRRNAGLEEDTVEGPVEAIVEAPAETDEEPAAIEESACPTNASPLWTRPRKYC